MKARAASWTTARWSANTSGMATAELAVALPTLVVVVAFAAALLHAVGAELRCADAARIGARAAARGESQAQIVGAAKAAAPPGAVVQVTISGTYSTVSVTSPVTVPGPWAHAGVHWRVTARAVAPAEPAAAGLIAGDPRARAPGPLRSGNKSAGSAR